MHRALTSLLPGQLRPLAARQNAPAAAGRSAHATEGDAFVVVGIGRASSGIVTSAITVVGTVVGSVVF